MEILITIVFTVAVTAAIMTICHRAGYSMWWGLIAVVPFVNFVFLLIFAARSWPIERELAQLRLGISPPEKHSPGFPILLTDSTTSIESPVQQVAPRRKAAPADVAAIFEEAARLERRGDWEQAISIYDQLADQIADSKDAKYANNCAAILRQRLQQRSSNAT